MGALPPILAMFEEPPVFYSLGTASPMKGQHTHQVWRGLVGRPDRDEPGSAMVLKLLHNEIELGTELACALAGRALEILVPPPALVICPREDLPGLDVPNRQSHLTLFGSELQYSAGLLGEPVSAPGQEQRRWTQICETSTAPVGASWDELVANDDRHTNNLLFDGVKWWLFDHDRALPPIAEVFRRFTQKSARDTVLEYQAPKNVLAYHLSQRGKDAKFLTSHAARFHRLRSRLEMLRRTVGKWHDVQQPQLRGVFEVCSVVLDSIHLRLPALAHLIELRFGQEQTSSLSW